MGVPIVPEAVLLEQDKSTDTSARHESQTCPLCAAPGPRVWLRRLTVSMEDANHTPWHGAPAALSSGSWIRLDLARCTCTIRMRITS